ncbi:MULTISPECIES: hypothetical protein [Haloferax]|uniref:Uncharacterized protein n=1 Tax=Haloferax marinum TaxID=2666143 RepID=A0A6A8G4D3_9EURY|nr:MULTISPECIES: hypothetical protein [Haloferax]KAB1196564.1 hypothetical protein Hfx1150_03140 [Haloferax sp. CBA1150]MRW95567.1 hypothetical protein [Haloferax marinum]
MDDDDERPSNRPRERGVIDTDDLDISHDERVARIDSGRYVITTGNTPPRPKIDEPDDGGEESVENRTSDGADDANDDDIGPDQQDDRPEVVLPRDPRKRALIARRLLAERVGAIQADHALVATALVDGSVEKHESVSNDVTEVFHSLVTWYADAVGSGETPVDEVLGILLLASEVQVTYPGRAVAALAAAHGLDRDDSIGQLLDAVDESGASFPPRRQK